jgi:hypothetical protein
MKRDTVIQLASILVAVISLGLAGAVSLAVTNSAGRHQLTYADTAEEGDPPEVALGIAMGAFRGVFVNFLWYRANEMKEQGYYYEAMELARAITKLQPRFPQVWVFHAWNMAYNISVKTQTPEERWQWVQAGIRLLRNEGIRANPNDLQLHKELAWIFLHKVAGITDDSNQYYKRWLAEEWTVVLGDPPPRSAESRTRRGAIEQYVGWLRPYAEAADTTEELAARSPEAIELMARVARLVDGEDTIALLRRYEAHRAMRRSVHRTDAEQTMGENNRAFGALIDDPRYAEAWPHLLTHLRRRLLIDEYNMEPSRMIRFTRKYGPIDWRHPAAHALYWSARGVEESLTRWTEENKGDFDFINTDRVTIQSLQELYRSGDVYFNYFDSIAGGPRPIQYAPNPHFVRAYGEVLRELIDRSWADADKRPYRVYAAGYENFLRDAVRFFYRRGQIDLASEYYTELGTFPGRNVHDPFFDTDVSVPLDEFVYAELQEDRIRSPYVLVSEVYGSLQGAYMNGLLAGDDETFRSSFEWARQAHRYYQETQVRDIIAAGQETRTGVLDPDFRIVAGDFFARTIQFLSVDEAADMYGRAPVPLRQFAYDFLAAAWKPKLDEQAEQGVGEPFERIFPEPPGMAGHRAWLERVAEERRQKRIRIEAK